MSAILSMFMLFLAFRCAQQQNSMPARLPQVTIGEGTMGTCPPAEVLEEARNDTRELIQYTLRGKVSDSPTSINSSSQPPCPCGGPGSWRRIAHLNMSDPNQQCPSNWSLVTTPERACGRSTPKSCDSAFFTSHGQYYSRVCGRVNAYQKGTTDAFEPSIDGRNPTLDCVYLDGISLTHGAVGSRHHIWSFVAALYEEDPDFAPRYVCPCTNTNASWPYQVPSFVGNDYFCDTGNPGPGFSTRATYPDDPLWDGEGCGPTNACCQFNTPPWFCTTLPQPTRDDIELRICSDNNFVFEDVNVRLVDIFVM